MVTAARDRLARTLRGDVKSAFSAELTARLDDLSVEIEGLGRVKFPVTPATSRKMIGLGQPARFGRGEETLTDPNVRHTWEIPKHLVGVNWNEAVLKEALLTVKEELGLPNAAELTAELHSFLVYETGQFFLAHQDSEKSDDMVGTLVVTLPSSFTGGELIVEHNSERTVHRGSRTAVSLAAFYADCRHEVLEVNSGYRITVTYNLLLRGQPSHVEGKEGLVNELAEFLGEHFRTPVPRYYSGPLADPPGRLVYLLDYEYTPRALKWSRLKGDDAGRVHSLRAAAEKAGCEAILALADVRETHEAYRAGSGWEYREYDEYDDDDDDADSGSYAIHSLVDSSVTLTHWTGSDGTGLEEISLYVPDTEACASTPSGALDPYSQEYEGYMGNYGNTLDRWYHRAAVVIWPRDRAFANRAEASPAWALDELAGLASSGDVAGACTAAATLAPFWRGAWIDDDLFSKALRAADLVEDPATASLLLRPFRIGSLTSVHARPFARIADRYGREWTAQLLRSSFGEDERNQGPDAPSWVVDSLPELCQELCAIGGPSVVAAEQLVDLAWRRIGRSVRSAFATSLASWRDSHLEGLGRPLAAILKAATVTGAVGTRDLITEFVRQHDDDVVTVLEVAVLRTAVKSKKRDALDDPGLNMLADDCAERLRLRLARPVRAADDWSIRLPANGCTCQLCGTLGTFLGARDRRTLEWPLAKDARQHVHSRIDGAELPVTHTTRRQGRPYTLILVKTDALFARELEARAKDEADLAWLAGAFSAQK